MLSIVLKYNEKQKNFIIIYQIKNSNGTIKLEQLTKDLSNYKLQYLAVINEKGEKVVWINLFCKDSFGK